MACQKEIASAIVDNQADYILAVKGNQAQLHQDILDEFRLSENINLTINQDLDHGRIETRKCSVISDFQFIKPDIP